MACRLGTGGREARAKGEALTPAPSFWPRSSEARARPRRECNCRRWFHRRDRASLRGRAGGGPTRWGGPQKSTRRGEPPGCLSGS